MTSLLPGPHASSPRLPSPSALIRPPPAVVEAQVPAIGPTMLVSHKKARKPRKAKSEAIIINSDSPAASPARVIPTNAMKTPKVLETCAFFASPSPLSRVPLSELLGNYGYVGQAPAPPQRDTTGEAQTKRRRIELADAMTVSAVPKKRKKVQRSKTMAETETKEMMPPPAPKPKKRAKEPKKAQTITALATAPYQPPKKQDVEQEAVVSLFFAPRAELPIESPNAIIDEVVVSIMKSRKSRKPRVKKSIVDDPDAPLPPAAKKAAAKPRKPKAVPKDHAPPRSPLLPPERASLQLHQQAFLFGTSSQLAVPESPTFIRELQAAILDSETGLVGSQMAAKSPAKGSKARVASAPHGTCLSVEQAEREMWAQPARDFKGGLYRHKIASLRLKAVSQVVVENGQSSTSALQDEPLQGHMLEKDRRKDDGVGGNRLNVDRRDDDRLQDDTKTQQQIRDEQLMHDSASDDALKPESEPNVRLIERTSVEGGRPICDHSKGTRQQDDWHEIDQITDEIHESTARLKVINTKETAINLCSSSPLPTPPATIPAPPPAASQQRSRSQLAIAPPIPDQPPALPHSDDWHNIEDEISDSDSDLPITPSPPRRRASASPIPISPLAFSLPPSPSPLRPKTPGAQSSRAPAIAPTAPLMSSDAQWAELRPELFARITEAIRSAPNSLGRSKGLSWHEKILLYDPIVLEDLTDWLNAEGRGIGVKVRRFKAKEAKTRKKGKGKKKDRLMAEEDGRAIAAAAAIVERRKDDVEAAECQVVFEEVKLWMTQKWCEARGVCCLRRDGLRGGVKNRY